jgi:uncharacterized protein YraI
MKISAVLLALTPWLALTPALSDAQQFANLARDANLRAGPSRDYPVVAELPAGMSVWVDGCINGYRWCDVTVGPDRGWVYAGNIIYTYQGARVPLLNYGAVIGIGIIAFSLGDYWDNHYRTRPWYPQPRPVLRPDADHIRPLPVRPPNWPDGMHRPPSGQPPIDVQHPPLRPPPPPGQLPPRSRPAGANPTAPHAAPPDHAQRPPQAQVPAKTPRPPQSQALKEAQRPPQGQPQKETQRLPQGQPRGGDKREPWEDLPGGGKK